MLTDVQLRSLKPSEKSRKVFDGRGLYILVSPTGGLLWRFKYRFYGKEKSLSFGRYPEVPLKLARERRDEARRHLANGTDPSVARKIDRARQGDTFKAVATELFSMLRRAGSGGDSVSPSSATTAEIPLASVKRRRVRSREPISAETVTTMERRLESHVYPYVGSRDIRSLTSPEVLRILRRIEERGTYELAHRVRAIIGRVMRYAAATGRDCNDVAASLIGVLTPVQPQPMATIVEPQKIGALLRAIDGYRGEPITRLALKLVPYVFTRPIELRTMQWSHLNLDGETPEWRVPWRRMKMRKPHIVPLSRQAVVILEELRGWSGDAEYVFPNPRDVSRPMSENCITAALRYMGFSGDEMSWHGFRAMASTQLNELGWKDKWVDAQLAHADRNKVSAAYNHAKYLPQRRAMMQAWGDHLDELRASGIHASVKSIEERAEAVARAALREPNPYERLRENEMKRTPTP